MNRIIMLYVTLSSWVMASYKFTILFNSIPHDSDCRTACGLSCHLEALEYLLTAAGVEASTT
jgi:hypothetical protein